LYDVSTNHVINSIVAHNQDDAWQQADDWLRSIGAEDRSTYKQRFAIRPMMASGKTNPSADIANYNGRWEIRSPTGGLITHVFGDYQLAQDAKDRFAYQYENPAQMSVRPAPEEQQPQQQTQGQRHNYEFYSHEDPNTLVDHMTNATAEEVRARIAQHERNGMPPGFLRVRQV
jgi:hypothetical protein